VAPDEQDVAIALMDEELRRVLDEDATSTASRTATP
jgi:hypothetical protein